MVYKVNYKGKNIATVSKKEEVSKAVDKVVEIVNSKGAEFNVEEPEIVPTVVVEDAVDSDVQVVNKIIENTEEIVEASTLFVDGSEVLVGDSRELISLMDEYLEKFEIEGTKCESRFVQKVELKKGYFLSQEVKNKEQIKPFLNSLTVETVVETTEISDVPFEKVTVKDAQMSYGATKTIIQGENGKKSIDKKSVYLNGVLVESIESEEVVLVAPKPEYEALGTKVQVLVAPSANVGAVLESGFVFPLPDKVWRVGAYFGDGRGHKGIDLCAPSGTAIMAAASGKVVYAGWRNGYGNYVEIEHGNGITTRYGHASALYVRTGEYVEAGKVIAAVGNTGDSDGFHLHFEIRKGGVAVNPAPYIGIK